MFIAERETMTVYVNGESIDPAAIEAEISRMRPSYQQVFREQPQDEQDRQLAQWAKENIIESVLFRQEAAIAFPDIADDEVQAALTGLLENEDEMGPLHQQMAAGPQEADKLRQAIAAQLRQDKLVRQITAAVPEPTEKELRDYYQAHCEEKYTMPAMVHAAHIVKHPAPETTPEQLRSEMQAIQDRLRSGTTFEALAREHSDCPEQAGDLGFFARGKMVQAFDDVVFNLEPGTCSDIFETEFGLHIAKVHEKRDAAACPFDQVRPVIARELTQQARERAIERFLDARKVKAVIEER
jgi:parvulin-like peptidyl-prolyl isomerase